MSVLIRCRVVNFSFRTFVSTMQKKVSFIITPTGSESSSSSGDLVEIISKIKSFIPDLTQDNHKGSCGKIGIIGGSSEFTGAPYFAGIAAMKLGADLVHIFCCKDAAIPIKSYSPELMIHPVLDALNVIQAFDPWLQRLHVLVIGPGLGKNSVILKNVGLIITYCKNKIKPSPPLIIDADGLHLISESPDLIRDYKGPVILTPNSNEYNKLAEKIEMTNCHELAAYFNAIIVKKGHCDTICNGLLINKFRIPQEESLLLCEMPGSYRRCGGQGDLLAGFIATFVAWHDIYVKNENLNLNFETEISNQDSTNQWKSYFKGYSYAAYGGCLMTRTCSNLGFKEFGRSLTTSDMITLIGKVFMFCFVDQ